MTQISFRRPSRRLFSFGSHLSKHRGKSALLSSLTALGLLVVLGLFTAPVLGQRPVIEQVRPRSGAIGTTVTLVGRGLTAQTRIFLGPVEMPVSQR